MLCNPVMPFSKQLFDSDLAVIDSESLCQNLGGDSILLAELVAIYRDELPKDLRTIQSALDDRNAKALECIAHRLKGSLQVLGASCSALAARVELDGRHGAIDAACVLQLISSLAAVAPALESILGQGGI